MDISQKDEYEKSIDFLKEKYKNEIEILKAYEVDFMQNSSLMLNEILNSKVDYLIGSVHFIQESK